MTEVTAQQAAAELIRRQRAASSVVEFAQAIDVPGRPASDSDDEWLFHPIETTVAAHHRVMMACLDKVQTRELSRLMIFAPPGSAKSSYASVVYPAYVMGKKPGSRIILGSYASAIAWKQSRRARHIARSEKFRPIFNTGLVPGNQSVEEWAMDNGSEYMAGGILAGMTGNRATDLIIDDPVSGREDAESVAIRRKTRESYEDDLSTRLMPGGATIIIQTRWHQDDLAGGILPVDWEGETGLIRCRDGLDWFVLCLPAIATRKDDPLGRKIGEPLWPEWFKGDHFTRFQGNQRTWSALFQQQPTPDTGGYFLRQWFDYGYDRLPAGLRIYGTSDYAVTPGGGDYTEHAVWGLDDNNTLYALDWWCGQTSSDVWIEKLADLIVKYSPLCWIGESGVIRRAVEPYMTTRLAHRQALTRLEWLPSIGDKPARQRGFQAMASMGKVRFPKRSAWHERVVDQLVRFPAAKHDDAADVCGLAANGMGMVGNVSRIKPIARDEYITYETDDVTGM